MRTRLSYVKTYKDRHGKTWFYFRKRGQPDIRLPGKPGSPEFMLAYNAALATVARSVRTSRSAPGSFGWTISAYYEDESFTSLAPSTQTMRRRILEKLRNNFGSDPVRQLTRGHIVSVILSQLPPFERNNWLKTLRGLMKFCLVREYITADPSAGIERSKAEAGSIHTWSEAEIAQYEARHGIGSTQRLALALLLFTAQRASDVVRMGPQHVKNDVLYVRQKKTRMQKEDRELAIPVLPELRRIIDASRCGDMAFLITQAGVPFTEKGFVVRFGDWCEQAGLPDGCSSHGLRKAGLVRFAEAGCTEVELRAISGHKNISELRPYIEKVEQRRAAERAVEKLIGGTQQQQVSNRLKSV